MCVKGSSIIEAVGKGGRAMGTVSIELSLPKDHNWSIRKVAEREKTVFSQLPTCPPANRS
jgi:hypothetical protein